MEPTVQVLPNRPPRANAVGPVKQQKHPPRRRKACLKLQSPQPNLRRPKGEAQPAPRTQKQLARNAPTAGSVHRVKTAAPAKIVLQETTVAHVKTAAHAKTVDHVKTGQPTPNADRAKTVDYEKTAGNGATAARAKTEAHAKTDQ